METAARERSAEGVRSYHSPRSADRLVIRRLVISDFSPLPGVDLPIPPHRPSRMHSGRRYNFLVMGGALLACLVFAVANTTIDPFRVTPVPWRAQALEPYRDIASQIRTGKAGLIRSGQIGRAHV